MDVASNILTQTQKEILKSLLYFDIFKYPLTRNELFQYSATKTNLANFELELTNLLQKGIIKEVEGFILTLERSSSDIIRRLKGNEGAAKMLPVALKYSRKIAAFPFVEAVCLSGSLSKNYFDDKSDLDYFIITKPNRLWLCRTFIILYYKFLSSSRKKLLCANYFISADNLVIPDINAFTGTELAFLIPTVNYPLYQNLIEKNNWYINGYPNKNAMTGDHCIDTPQPLTKRVIHFLLQGAFGNWLDNQLLQITHQRWRKKYPNMNDADFELQFRSRKDVCKRHSHGFQNKIILLWQNNLDAFESKFKFSLRS